MIKLDPPEDLRMRIEAAFGTNSRTEFITETIGDRYLIGIRTTTLGGHVREKTADAANQTEVDEGWRKLTEIAEASLIHVKGT